MEPSGFDYVARQISLYRDLLLAVPHWVKNQAFDIHISRGMPLSICGREGTLFPTKSGEVSRVPEQGVVAGDAQLRELFCKPAGIRFSATKKSSGRGSYGWARTAGLGFAAAL